MTRSHALAALAALAGPCLGFAAEMRADTSASALTVRVKKSGALSVFGHDHAFTPERWSAVARFDPARPSELRVDVVVEADSLRDHERGVSGKDRAQVDRQTAGPQVLDAKRFPQIRYRGSAQGTHRSADGGLQGILRGTLALHGAERPLDVPFLARPKAGGYVASGAASFRQSAFGIRPYATGMGTIGVRDEVRVEFELSFRSAAAGSALAPTRGGRDVAASGGGRSPPARGTAQP